MNRRAIFKVIRKPRSTYRVVMSTVYLARQHEKRGLDPIARDWLSEAQLDLESARLRFPLSPARAIFDAQQSTEKAIKCWLTATGAVRQNQLRKDGHNVAALIGKLAEDATVRKGAMAFRELVDGKELDDPGVLAKKLRTNSYQIATFDSAQVRQISSSHLKLDEAVVAEFNKGLYRRLIGLEAIRAGFFAYWGLVMLGALTGAHEQFSRYPTDRSEELGPKDYKSGLGIVDEFPLVAQRIEEVLPMIEILIEPNKWNSDIVFPVT